MLVSFQSNIYLKKREIFTRKYLRKFQKTTKRDMFVVKINNK